MQTIYQTLREHKAFVRSGKYLNTVDGNNSSLLAQAREKEDVLRYHSKLYEEYGMNFSDIEAFGIPGVRNNLQYLQEWENNPVGTYQMSFRYGHLLAHDVALVKLEDGVFLFDPNHGLFEFPVDRAAVLIDQFLKKFYGNIENHQIDINEVTFF